MAIVTKVSALHVDRFRSCWRGFGFAAASGAVEHKDSRSLLAMISSTSSNTSLSWTDGRAGMCS